MSQGDHVPPVVEASGQETRYVWTRGRKIIAGLLILMLLAMIAAQFTRIWASRGQTPAAPPPRPALPEGGLNMANLVLDPDDIKSGGPPVDGIPSLTDPDTVPVADAEFLRPAGRVIGVNVGGEWRAYPLAVLNWHEAINDRLGGVPIGVFYCPLCDSVSVVDRRMDGKTLEFGISGRLCNSNVLLYDRTDYALWSQIKLTAVSGPYAGQPLKHLADWELAPFGDFRKRHPDATVVTFQTGHQRSYKSNPYKQYFISDGLMFPVEGNDDRLAKKAPVIGVRFADVARAYPIDLLKKVVAEAPDRSGIVSDTIAGKTIRLGVDEETGTIRVIDAPDQAQVVHTFWFAWAAFHPETELFVPAR